MLEPKWLRKCFKLFSFLVVHSCPLLLPIVMAYCSRLCLVPKSRRCHLQLPFALAMVTVYCHCCLSNDKKPLLLTLTSDASADWLAMPFTIACCHCLLPLPVATAIACCHCLLPSSILVRTSLFPCSKNNADVHPNASISSRPCGLCMQECYHSTCC